MSRYLLLFSPSEWGTHTFRIEADSDKEALEKAHKRLESGMVSNMQYQVLKVETISDWKKWERA